MKKNLLIFAMMALSFSLMAQKGSWYIGGTVGYVSNSSKDASGFKSSTANWYFAPEGGTFLKDDIQLGLALGLGGSSSKNDNGKLSSTTNFSPTVYVRKFFKVTDNFSTFAGAYLNYISSKSTSYAVAPPIESTQSGIGLRLGVGIAYALSPRFTAVGQYGLMGYQTVSSKTAGIDNGTNSTFSFGANTTGGSALTFGNAAPVFNIGLYYTFKKS